MLKSGDLAPDFELPDQDGRPVRLSKQLTRGSVLLYFYPADFTPICTREACLFRDLHAQLSARDIQVFGISPQDSATHARFRQTCSLPFTLLADPEKRVIRSYGCSGPLGLGVKRVSYLIGRSGLIMDRVHAALRIRRHGMLVNGLNRPS